MEKISMVLLNIWEWLVANPPWFIGIAVVITILLWWLLHGAPQRTREWKAECRALERDVQQLRREEAAEKMQLKQERELQHEDAAKRLQLEEQNRQIRKQVGTGYEIRVAEMLLDELSDWVDTGRMRLLYDVRIPKAQIDIIILDTSGIYIIECKCWKGIIVGKHTWPYWFQIDCQTVDGLPQLEKVEYGEDTVLPCKAMAAPVEQNERHLAALKSFINQSNIGNYWQFKRLSVMNRTGYLDLIQKDHEREKVWSKDYIWQGTDDDLVSVIRDYDQRMPAKSRLSPADVNTLFGLLKPHAAAYDVVWASQTPCRSL